MFVNLALFAVLAVVPGEQAGAQRHHCLKALVMLPADAVPLTGKFMPAVCSDPHPAPAFRYERVKGASQTLRPIAQGEVVPLFPEFGARMVQPGQKLHILVSDGAVRIERQVEAMQAARPGQKLFVRSDDGQILSVRYEEAP